MPKKLLKESAYDSLVKNDTYMKVLSPLHIPRAEVGYSLICISSWSFEMPEAFVYTTLLYHFIAEINVL